MSSDRDTIRPRIRSDKRHDLRDYFMQAIEAWTPELVTTCITCMHFNEPTETCGKFKMRPPARVIAYACKDYFAPDEIPF